MPMRHALTTTDNPYDPFKRFVDWLQYDTAMGYNTAPLLARLTVSSNELSDADQAIATEEAIDYIIENKFFGDYIKVSEEIEESEE